MSRVLIFIYGVLSYAFFFGTFLYAIGWVGGFIVPTSLDDAPTTSLGVALAVNFTLLTVFALQHSVMARPSFKTWWCRFVPVPAERSTYVLFSSVAMLAFFLYWQPLGGVVWQVDSALGEIALWSLYATGWATILVTTFLIDHFDLFGLRQVTLNLLGKPYTSKSFVTPIFYRWVRHPLYVGWLLTFWAAPTMTVSRLVFAIGASLYILAAIQFEERDLVRALPGYAAYRERVGMLLPKLRRSTVTKSAATPSETPETVTAN